MARALLLALCVLAVTIRSWAEEKILGNEFGTWIVPWDEADASAEIDCFDHINPFAFGLAPDHQPLLAYPGLLERAKRLRRGGVVIAPVVVNDIFVGEKLEVLKSGHAVSQMLLSSQTRHAHIQRLAKIASEFDGVEVDYERIPARAWEEFVLFIEQLGQIIHQDGKRLFVDLEPGFVYNRDLREKFGRRLAAATDGVKLMAYYERSGMALRPSAGNSLSWVVETARQGLRVVPDEKLVVVVSLAGTDWESSFPVWFSPWRARRVHYGRVLQALSLQGGHYSWDETSSCPVFPFAQGGKRHEMWFENEQSLAKKISALREIGIRRISLWYWGRQHPDPNILGLCRN